MEFHEKLNGFSPFKKKPTQFKFRAHFTCAKALPSVFSDFKTCNISTVPSLNSSLLLHVSWNFELYKKREIKKLLKLLLIAENSEYRLKRSFNTFL